VSEVAITSRSHAPASGTGVLVAGTYAVLGVLLVLPRLAGLGNGLTSDEIVTLRDYVREGPSGIVAGAYIPNNHELFSLLGWALNSIFGESTVALRLASIVPFVVGVALVTSWLHRRFGPPSGIVFLFCTTVSPLLLDITRHARGYGLAFLAMSVMTLAALEAVREPRIWTIVAFCVAGVGGTMTLPIFGIAFGTAAAVLLVHRALRWPVAIGIGLSLAAVLTWYWPHLADLAQNSRQEYGRRIEGAWVIAAPIDQIIVPALGWIDETLVEPGVGSVLLTAAIVLLLVSSPLLRRADEALILCAGAVTTVATVWFTDTYEVPRFFSFLLVPLLMLLATGVATIFEQLVERRRAGVRSVVAVGLLVVFVLIAAPNLWRMATLPRDATRDVASAIREDAPPSTPVVAYVPYPHDIEFFLHRHVHLVRTPQELAAMCSFAGETVFVSHLWLLPPVDVPCTARPGTRHLTFRQYARTGRIDVWFIPPKSP
jgi:hypothetical protein